MNLFTATVNGLLVAAFVAATLQGSRLPEPVVLESLQVVDVRANQPRVCTPPDERNENPSSSPRAWA